MALMNPWADSHRYTGSFEADSSGYPLSSMACMYEKVLMEIIGTAFLGKHEEVHPGTQKGEWKERANTPAAAQQHCGKRTDTETRFCCVSASVGTSYKRRFL